MTAQDALHTAIMAAAFLLVAWAMLTGGTGEPTPTVTHGRHRAGRPRPVSLADIGIGDALPFVAGPDHRNEPDDWTSYLPTEELPVITVRTWIPGEHERRHTSPSETARRRWQTETPIFVELAAEFGYDPTELVAA